MRLLPHRGHRNRLSSVTVDLWEEGSPYPTWDHHGGARARRRIPGGVRAGGDFATSNSVGVFLPNPDFQHLVRVPSPTASRGACPQPRPLQQAVFAPWNSSTCSGSTTSTQPFGGPACRAFITGSTAFLRVIPPPSPRGARNHPHRERGAAPLVGRCPEPHRPTSRPCIELAPVDPFDRHGELVPLAPKPSSPRAGCRPLVGRGPRNRGEIVLARIGLREGPCTTVAAGALVRSACAWRSRFTRASASPGKMTTASDHVAPVHRNLPPSIRSAVIVSLSPLASVWTFWRPPRAPSPGGPRNRPRPDQAPPAALPRHPCPEPSPGWRAPGAQDLQGPAPPLEK
jgi:hypothetical protein